MNDGGSRGVCDGEGEGMVDILVGGWLSLSRAGVNGGGI